MEWKPIKDFPNYWISDIGLIKSTWNGKEKILHQFIGNNGYKYVHLSKNKQNKNYSVHRLVAQTFIDNSYHYSEVNHLNKNRQDARVKNLEWCSRQRNIRHRFETTYYQKPPQYIFNYLRYHRLHYEQYWFFDNGTVYSEKFLKIWNSSITEYYIVFIGYQKINIPKKTIINQFREHFKC